MKRYLVALLLLLGVALPSNAGIFNPGQGGGGISSGFTSVTEFPGSPSVGDTVVVTDDSAVGACDSDAGSAVTLCRWNGSSWLKLGDGTGTGGSLTSGDIDTSAEIIAIVTDETGTGALVFANGPTLVAPVLGTPASANLANATNLPISTGVSGLGANVAAFLATPTTANLATAVTSSTGTGALVLATSPTLVTPNIGTPSAGVLTNATGLPISTGVDGLGTGVATFLGTPSSANLASAVTGETGSGALVFATSPTLVTPALGTPASGVLTNATGLPISTGVSGLGTGVATFLATPSSANLASAITDETGSGVLVFGTAPTVSSAVLATKVNLPRVTSLPGGPSAGDTVIVTDDSSAGACDSAAGGATTLCQYNGSAWVPLGDGGAGGGSGFDAITSGTNTTAAMFVGTGGSLATSGSGTIVATSSALATALAADGANCSAGQFPLGVDASGAVQSCTALPTTISGTANEINASASTGAITLSIPATLNLSSKTVRIPNGTELPGTCTVGDQFMDTDATSGARFYLCESTNTWMVQGSGGAGTVTSVDASGGVETASGSPITATGTIQGAIVPRDVTGTTDTLLTGHRGGITIYNNGTGVSVGIAEAGTTGFEANWYTLLSNRNADVTITPTTSTINGNADLTLTNGQWAYLISDGTNYRAVVMNGILAEADTLQTAFARGKEITGANSEANCFRVGNGTSYGCLWWDATAGWQFKTNPVSDTVINAWTDKNIEFFDKEGAAAIETIDPDAASKNAMYQYGANYKPRASVFVALSPRGAVTMTEENILTNQPKSWWGVLTDANTDAFDFMFPITKKMEGMTTATVRLTGVSKNATPSGNIDLDCAMQAFRPGTDTFVAHSTTGEQTVLLTPATQNRPVATTSSAITINGTIAEGGMMVGSCEVDATATTSAQLTDFRLWGFATIQFLVNSRSD